MSHRFYVPPDHIRESKVGFSPEQRKQIRSVLRLRPEDEVRVFDGSGAEHRVRLVEAGDSGEIFETSRPCTEPPVRLTLVQGLPKGDKIELILQKCTEIGVSEFLIVETARSVPHITRDKLAARLQRWRSIVKEAAEQSGRVSLPEVHGVLRLADAFSWTKRHAFIAWEQESDRSFTAELSGLSNTSEISLFIGPEGGFTPEEVVSAQSAGITSVSLGPRILRTETAAIVASALVVYR